MLNGFFFSLPSLLYLEGSKQRILSFFSFLLLHFFVLEYDYMFAYHDGVYGGTAAVGLFCLAERLTPVPLTPVFLPLLATTNE